MSTSLRTIVVDLTPLLPGGENGGAKVFILELLSRLAEIAPQTQFILLTQAAAHEELAALDRPNMRRLITVDVPEIDRPRPRLLPVASFVLARLPVRLKRVVSQLRYALNTMMRHSDSEEINRRVAEPLLRTLRADLLFCPFTMPTYSEVGTPTICTIHDLQHKTYPEFFTEEDLAERDRIFNEACRRATALAAVSEYSRDTAVSQGSLVPTRVRTIHHRIAGRILSMGVMDKEILSRLGLIPNRYLLYPANFWKHKNHEMLLTAFGMACQAGLAADIQLVCTGAPGARQEWLTRAAHAMNLAERVLFPGYLPNEELATLIANCRGLVFPSLYEGFGLPVVEAMAAGVPVACSNNTSLPEVAANAAILFDPRIPTQIAQAMLSLVEDEELRAFLIQAGLQRASEFSDSQRMAREYWELFEVSAAGYQPSDRLSGVYPDGWAGPRIHVELAPAKKPQALTIELFAPQWLPHARVHIKSLQSFSRHESNQTLLGRGESNTLILHFPVEGGVADICVTPSFVPAHSGFGKDTRDLSVLLRQCIIERGATDKVVLHTLSENILAAIQP